MDDEPLWYVAYGSNLFRNAPTAPYLTMLGNGLREAHGWSAGRAASYLAGRPGAHGAWTARDITALLG